MIAFLWKNIVLGWGRGGGGVVNVIVQMPRSSPGEAPGMATDKSSLKKLDDLFRY